jgi:hypothetical protein
MKRKVYDLTSDEAEAFRKMLPVEGAAFKFWCRVAAARWLDASTIIGLTGTVNSVVFSALPLGHGKPWCWPAALRCGKPPSVFEELKNRPVDRAAINT